MLEFLKEMRDEYGAKLEYIRVGKLAAGKEIKW
jgi:hypothetical protein